MTVEIDFNPYLELLRSHYAEKCRFYTPTDAETKIQLRVQTVSRKSQVEDNAHPDHYGVFEKYLNLIEAPPKSPNTGGLRNSELPSIGGQGGVPRVFETSQGSSYRLATMSS
jgi:hypothetical protein